MEATPFSSLTSSAARSRILGGMSVRDLAKSVGLSHSYVSRVLRGKRRPVLETAKRIATKRGLTLDGFYTLLGLAVKEEGKAKAKARPKPKPRGRKRW